MKRSTPQRALPGIALCLLLALPDLAPAADIAPDTVVRSLTVRIRMAHPESAPDPKTAAYASTNDTVHFDTGRLFLLLDSVHDGPDKERKNVLDHDQVDTFVFKVPEHDDTRHWLDHHARRRLPAGIHFSDLRRLRFVHDRNGKFPCWHPDRVEVRVNGTSLVSTPLHRWLGDEFGNEADIPGFRPAPTPKGAQLATGQLDLDLTVEGRLPWEGRKPRISTKGKALTADASLVDHSIVFNLGGLSWRLTESLLAKTKKLENGDRTLRFALPLRSPLRRKQVRVVELYRQVDWPAANVFASKGFPPWAYCVRDLVLRAGDKRIGYVPGPVLGRTTADGRFFYVRKSAALPSPADRRNAAK